MRMSNYVSEAVLHGDTKSNAIRYQEGNGYLNDRRLESFGHLLDDYILQGADLIINKKTLFFSEGIISFSDQLWRAFSSEFRVVSPDATYYMGYLIDTGYVFGPTEPTERYMRLWEIKTNALGEVSSSVDHRGKLNRVKFKAIYDGVYLNTQEVLDAIKSVQTGPKGDPGQKGDPGVSGVNGKTWLLGTIAPTSGQGVVGDLYLNTTTWDISEKTNATVWTLRGNVRGGQGLKGDPGNPGSAGMDGKTWLSGNATPTSGQGVVGDFHLNTSTWDVNEKTTATVWTVRGNIKGIKGDPGNVGATGTTGLNGKTWSSGTIDPASGLGVVGDFYLNTSTWDVSEKTTTTVWTVRGNIKGIKGDTGPRGADGTGSVSKVNNIAPTGGNVTLTADDVGAVTKIAGKQLSTEDYTTTEKTKLGTLVNYTHPATHPPSIIAQDINNRFMTDAERTKLTGLSNYTHPATHPPSIIAQDASNRFVTDVQIAKWELTVIELRTSDPVSPVVGQMWLRTDL